MRCLAGEVHGTVPRECARECNDVALRGWSSVTAGWEHVSSWAELRGAECKEAHAQQAQSTTKPRSDPFCGAVPIVGSAPVRARDTSILPFCDLGLFAISSRNSYNGFLTVMILVYAPLSPLQHLTTPYNTTLAPPHLLLALLPLAWLEPGFQNRALLPCHQIVEGC